MSDKPKDKRRHAQAEISKRVQEAVLYLSTVQVCARYSVSRTTIWRWVQSGRLPEPVQIGPGIRRFRLADLDRLDAEWASQESAA